MGREKKHKPTKEKNVKRKLEKIQKKADISYDSLINTYTENAKMIIENQVNMAAVAKEYGTVIDKNPELKM